MFPGKIIFKKMPGNDIKDSPENGDDGKKIQGKYNPCKSFPALFFCRIFCDGSFKENAIRATKDDAKERKTAK
jgi:hypothetical protein